MHRHTCAVSAALLAAMLSACSSSSSSDGPSAQRPQPTANTSSPATSGDQGPTTFTSRFSPLPGLQLTLPTPGWSAADQAAEVIVDPPGLPGASLHITKGMYPADPSGAFLTTRPSSVSEIDALRRLSAFQSSSPVRERLGRLAAVSVDLRLSSSASAFPYLVYKGATVTAPVYTMRKGMSVRVYSAVYQQPYGHELLNIVVEAPSGKVFAQWTAVATRALRSLRLPKGLVPNTGVYD